VSITERDFLLEDEDPSTSFTEDARHWVTIYAQLVEFKRRLLDRVQSAMQGQGLERRAEMEREFELMKGELTRVESRLAFWQQRHWQMIGLDLDPEDHTVMYAGKKVHLTRREFQLLDFLASHPNRYFTSRAIVGSAWHDSRLSPEQLRLYVSRLREKLATLGPPCRIDNRPELGYGLRFDTP
jgi:DNA-binding response OmpR family regulator